MVVFFLVFLELLESWLWVWYGMGWSLVWALFDWVGLVLEKFVF